MNKLASPPQHASAGFWLLVYDLLSFCLLLAYAGCTLSAFGWWPLLRGFGGNSGGFPPGVFCAICLAMNLATWVVLRWRFRRGDTLRDAEKSGSLRERLFAGKPVLYLAEGLLIQLVFLFACYWVLPR
jgi:hypothetical protein